jgi:hypothetical protein
MAALHAAFVAAGLLPGFERRGEALRECPVVVSNARTISETTASPARMLPCAVQYFPILWPAHSVAFVPVNAATPPSG